MLAEHLESLRGLEPLAATDEPDAVHQARVEVRKMRSILQVFRPLFDAECDDLRRELRWAGEALGAPRDLEVAQAKLAALLDDLEPDEVLGPVRDRLESELAHLHDGALAGLREALASPRWATLHVLADRTITSTLTDRADAPAKTLTRLASRSEARVARQFATASEPPLDWARWHEVRKAAKGAHYAQDALVSLGRRSARRRLHAWQRVTSALGRVQDTVLMEQQLDLVLAAAALAGEPTRTYELLRGKLLKRRRRELAKGRARLKKALSAHPR